MKGFERDDTYALDALEIFAAFATLAQSGRGKSTWERTSRMYCKVASALVVSDIVKVVW